MMSLLQRFAAGLAAVCACLVLPAHAAPIVNGGFEAGFTNWTRADLVGSDGGFLIQSGTASPVNGITVPPPPEGVQAAMTDAQGPGSHVLYQDFVQTEQVSLATLSFDLFIGNLAQDFYLPSLPSLEFATPELNQQARVDILLAGGDPFSLGADLLLNAFQTNPGDALISGYTHIEVDITSLVNANLNTALRLRFAEVDNVNIFNFGVDNVAIETIGPIEVPEPAPVMLLLAGMAAATLQRRRLLRL
ncbi:PEP-CTERM sorting domain-containing protein [Massilia sp. ST3]|uniref:PEP-CTERM sorting domain-containing protein n=1 Tax=Massilia sp. ST3 TaxID=2824903 RepID=UPI001B811F42|nr:PEP-CTERM sorting domain-containing protein [Massilia sp. ST3]MBQ5946490.1 PEP-CTERM sorting domain-containing protein [Massilia sp. ST3]